MENANSKLGWIIAILLVGLSVMFYTGIIKQALNQDGLLGGISLDKYYLSSTATATTTPVALTTSGASSTLIMSVANAKHIDLNLMLKASTTATTLNWVVYFSSDDSNKNWYPEGGYTATSNTVSTEGASKLVHTWTPANGAASSTYKNVGIEPVASKYMKVEFGVAGANGELYAEGISQSDVSN